MFSCQFCEISHNTFFKEPFGRLLLNKHISSFQKWCHTYFPAEYFLGLIWRLGTRVGSTFWTLSLNSIFNPVKHLRCNFFAKIVNSWYCYECVFISFHRKGFSWLNKTNVMPEIRPAILYWGSDSVSSTFVATSWTIIAGTFKLATVQECQLNRVEPREVKGNT